MKFKRFLAPALAVLLTSGCATGLSTVQDRE